MNNPTPQRASARATILMTRLGSALVATLALAVPNASASSGIVPSLTGNFAVGCSNVEQDFSRLRSGESAADYWEGNPLADGSHYVTDLLLSPANALTYKVNVPSVSEIDVFEKQGGKALQYAAIVCYPTPTSNTRADYTLPSGVKVPRMQRGAEAPMVLANPATASAGKWPLLVMSHGLAGSPLGDDYVQVMARLAAEGYVVFAPFHADARYSRIKLNDLADYFYVLTKYAEIAEMQAIRPLGLKQGLDYLLAKPEYANVIDQDQIAGFGASLGGMAIMLVQGARMTTSWGGAERVIVRDNRYKAVVGYVPFSGYSFQPMFGASNEGVKGVRVPYLGIGGTADVVAPIGRTSEMISNLGGSKYFVTIAGMPHGFRIEDAPEVFGWTFAFLKAHLSRNQTDRALFNTIDNIPGGSDDVVSIRKTLAWGSRDELEVVEFYSSSAKKYFMTGRPDEIALLDSLPSLWQRTGHRFATHRMDAPLGSAMCRIWANDGATLNTHFYSSLDSDCALLRSRPWARDEGNVMRAQDFLPQVAIFPPPPPQCPADTVKVIRLFNTATVNHRYLTEGLLSRVLLTREWQSDGPVFCAGRYED